MFARTNALTCTHFGRNNLPTFQALLHSDGAVCAGNHVSARQKSNESTDPAARVAADNALGPVGQDCKHRRRTWYDNKNSLCCCAVLQRPAIRHGFLVKMKASISRNIVLRGYDATSLVKDFQTLCGKARIALSFSKLFCEYSFRFLEL